ncbi:MAG: alanine:cation symporter family protein [Clostridia bacterium]|nr:alanine:cation symporter family protein [Clostridia bacterium]
MIDTAVANVNNALYTYVLIIILILSGLYFTVRTRFAPFRLFRRQIQAVTEKPKGKDSVSSFQALMVSTASRVGTGNIIGVSTAICLGGFGSIFWMWLIALIGSATALIESTLAQIYKRKGPDGWYGGPAYYIETGCRSRGLAIVFSVFLILTYGIGFNMLASYNLQSTFSSYGFYNPETTPWAIGLVLALVVGYCLFGGGKRLVKVTSVLVPVMGLLYIAVALFIVLLNIQTLPGLFARIFSEAFDVKAIFGGFSGSCVMYGIKRGLFSNEAGVGSAPNASASADVSHPVKQGLVQILSVFLDTLLVCSATAFMCMCSGVEPTEALSGAPYVQASMMKALGQFGPAFITVSMILFAFTTLLGNLYYVDQSLFFMLGHKPGKRLQSLYYILASLVIFLGAGLSADLLWGVADIAMGAMTMINIPVILILGKYALRALSDYDKKTKQGGDIYFKAEDIDLPHKVDCWK